MRAGIRATEGERIAMAKPYDFGRVEMDVDAGRSREVPARPEDETPFRILLLGDFSGREARGVREPLAGRRAIPVDRDNFEAVMARLKVRVGSAQFKELDDFHPDRLFSKLPLFAALRHKREMLRDPSTFAEIKKQFADWAGEPKPEKVAAPPAKAASVTQSIASTGLFDDMLAATESRGVEAKAARGGDPFEQYLRAIVAPHLEAKPDPRQAELIAGLDQGIAEAMRQVLHHSEFQALEAAWRGLFFMIRELETGPDLKVFLFDATPEEILDDLSSGDLAASVLYQLIVEQTVHTPGAPPWSLVGGVYNFGLAQTDLALLEALGTLGRMATAPFLAGARSIFVGCKSIGETPLPRGWKSLEGTGPWQEYTRLRRSPVAPYVGLALPRFLLRLPYGKDFEATEEFAFEEFEDGRAKHEDYAWGNPVFLCAMLIGSAFREWGWEFQPGMIEEVRGLPLHVFKQDGESCLKPPAEALLTMEGANIMIEHGLIPLISMKDSDRVRVGGFRSIASGNKPLAGRWRTSS
jgi:type VI secretion system protein ImpC